MLPYEARQFVSACRIASVYCLTMLALNIYEGLEPRLLLLMLVLILCLQLMSWLTPRTGLTWQLQWAFAACTAGGLGLAWFLSSGLLGSVPLALLLTCFLALSISDVYRVQFGICYVLVGAVCSGLQLWRPSLVFDYPSTQLQLLDNAAGVILALVALSYATDNFKGSYDRQRARVQRSNERIGEAMKDLQRSHSKLQDVMRTNHEHLHVIAHDLRNPVGAVIGLVEVCREEYELGEDVMRDLATMETAAQQALELIQHLSQVAYLEERRVTLTRGKAKLAPLLQTMLRKWEPSARRKQQSLVATLDESAEASVDSQRFAQIVDNLVQNAVKYSPLGAPIEVVLLRQGEDVVICVRDTGPGIPDDQRDRLFTMFGKVGTRPTGKETSTGLGLYISKMLAELHDGELEQENHTGGCEFRLRLPAV